MIDIQQYRDRIKKLKPLDISCEYVSDKWSKQFVNTRHLQCVKDYRDKEINRRFIIQCFKEYYKDSKSDFKRPFLLTMIWGFYNAGYGPHRTFNYLINPVNHKPIIDSFQAIHMGDIDQAFLLLSKIQGLGVSFISKLLYFAGKASELRSYPLIFDIRVARALVILASGKELSKIVKVFPSDKLDNYKAYNQLLHSWARDLKVKADQIEYFLFMQEF